MFRFYILESIVILYFCFIILIGCQIEEVVMIIGQNPYINRIQNNKNAGFKQLKLKQSKEAWEALGEYKSFDKWCTDYLNRHTPEEVVRDLAAHAKEVGHKAANLLEQTVKLRYPKK